MPHVDDGTLHALLDGALRAESPERAAEVEAHLAACADCRARAAAADELRAEASRILEASAPAAAGAGSDFSEVRRRARGDAGAGSSRRRVRREARWTRGLAWAASLVLALGTGYLIRDLTGPAVDDDRARPVPSEATESGTMDRGTAGAPATAEPRAAEREPAAPEQDAIDGGARLFGAEEPSPAPAPPEIGATEPEAGADAPAEPGPERAPVERALGADTGRQEGARTRDVAGPPSGGAEAEAPAEVRAESLEVSAAPPPAGSDRWSAATLEEARAALDGPVYLLPRAELVEVYLLDDGDQPRVMTLQRLQTGVPVQVVQWRGDDAETEWRTAGVSELSDRVQQAGDASLPGANVARVVREDYILELTGSLPAGLLSVLGETADPAP